MRLTIIALITLVVTGCASGYPISVSQECGYIGCETGGLVIYPHEENSATELPRRWYGVNGELPSDYPAGSQKRKTLRRQQIEKLRSMGLDAQGRPLNQ